MWNKNFKTEDLFLDVDNKIIKYYSNLLYIFLLTITYFTITNIDNYFIIIDT